MSGILHWYCHSIRCKSPPNIDMGVWSFLRWSESAINIGNQTSVGRSLMETLGSKYPIQVSSKQHCNGIGIIMVSASWLYRQCKTALRLFIATWLICAFLLQVQFLIWHVQRSGAIPTCVSQRLLGIVSAGTNTELATVIARTASEAPHGAIFAMAARKVSLDFRFIHSTRGGSSCYYQGDL